ncbi:MAG: hypothetical protein WCI43_05060 [Candidatus Firestonebacteria bacterium]
MKRAICLLFLSVIMLLPVKLPAQEDVLEDSILQEVEEVWSTDVKKTFNILLKIGKVIIITPKTANPEPLAAAPDKDYGFIPFNRSYLARTYYNYRPTEAERKFEGLKAFASPGEFEPITFCLYPLESSKLSISVSDLTGKVGTIPSQSIEIGAARHLLHAYAQQLYEVRPELIKKGGETDLKKGVNRTIWLTLKVPEKAAAGIYIGEITLKGGKNAFKTKLTIEVLPVKLLSNPNFSVGWYGMPKDDVYMKDAIDHGCNAVDTGLEPKMEYTEGKIKLDFTGPAKRVAQLKELGLEGYTHQFLTLGYANDLINTYGIPEFSSEFNKLYKEINAQMVKWYKDNKIKVAFWLVDEPREDVLESWNRHLKETLQYVKLAKEVPGLIALVDPMGDENMGVDYTGFCDVLDVLATHSYDGSKKMLAKCKAGANAELWLYNSGRTRMSFGFNPWKWHAKGRWEWAYAWGWTEKVSLSFKSWSTYGGGDPACGIIYPSAEGPQKTPSFEMCREGVDDYKYLYTLEQKIAEAGKSGKPEAVAAAKKAQAMLDLMDKQTPDYPVRTGAEVDNSEKVLDEWRYQVAQEIIRIDRLIK